MGKVLAPVVNNINVMMNFIRDTTPISNTSKKAEEKVEKLFIQPKDSFEAIDFGELDVIDASEKHAPRLIEGENYTLQGITCDGFEMEKKVYKLIKVVDEFYGTRINSVIVKQISGEHGIIFTLSKNDCEYHGIEYENGLQLFPKGLNWVRVKEKIPFNKNNLATTPVSDIDNTIRFIVLKLNGFKDYSDGYIITPSGHLVTENHFANSLRVKTVEPIVYGNGYIIQDKTDLNIQLVYPKGVLFKHGNFISADDSIYLMIRLKEKYMNPFEEESKGSIDGYFGVEPKYLDNISPNDFFEISWDEFGAYTTEEYEALKAEKARKKAEMIKKAEEEHRRKIEEEEKRIIKKNKRIEDAITRMKNYGMRVPRFPNFIDFNFDGTVGSIDMIANGFNAYFNSLSSSLKTLNEDLDMGLKLSRTDSLSNKSKNFNQEIEELVTLELRKLFNNV